LISVRSTKQAYKKEKDKTMTDYLKQSIISTIMLMNDKYSFNSLFSKEYSELEIIRDAEIINYNERIKV
jgi:hypothetical protein